MKELSEGKQIHEGHRQRVKRKFLEYGFTPFHDHEILEMLLFYGIPQKDTNPIAHELLNSFGTIKRVFEAPYEELLKVPGIGENAAVLIKMIPLLAKRYAESGVEDKRRIYSTAEAVKVLRPKFIGESEEIFVLMLMGSDGRLLFCKTINRGSIHEVLVYIREITKKAIQYKADMAIVAHNHPNGNTMPSTGDLNATREVIRALESINVHLEDHIIFAGESYNSMKKSGWIDYILSNPEKRSSVSSAAGMQEQDNGKRKK